MALTKEKLQGKSLSKILEYHTALKEICERYERELGPLYNSRNPKDIAKWNEISGNFHQAKRYYNMVFEAMRQKCFSELQPE